MSVTTKHSDILEYWKKKCITRDGRVVSDNDLNSIEVVTDWGEPSCWACGKPIVGDYEKNHTHGAYEIDEIPRLWNDPKVKSKLNRCHIVPAAKGGKDSPDNLFLLCEECHFLSPDTKNPVNFFRWVHNRREKMAMGELKWSETLKLVDEDLASRGLPTLLELIKISKGFNLDGFDEFIREHSNSHMGTFVLSTKIAVITDFIVKKFNDSVLEEV